MRRWKARRELEREVAERRELERQLRRMATTDALTGVLNRAQVLALGQKEMDRARGLDQGLAVLMIDVDHFKAINDKHGHATGDEALKHLVARLLAGVRRIDLIGRLGGEEFAIVLPAVTPETAGMVGERLRSSVAGHPLQCESKQIRMTVSIGVSMVRRTDHTVEQVLARADTQLYRAKDGGRNRVCHDEDAVAA
jgi:diguanylate cyclase (GGDEF)-like protein